MVTMRRDVLIDGRELVFASMVAARRPNFGPSVYLAAMFPCVEHVVPEMSATNEHELEFVRHEQS